MMVVSLNYSKDIAHICGFLTNCTRFGLVTERVNDLWAGSDECETGLLDFASESCVFCEETVTSEEIISIYKVNKHAWSYPG